MNWYYEQQKALNTSEGILRLYGGPGTGKTEVLLTLAAEIIAGESPADEIVFISPTSAKARILEQRLFGKIGNNPVVFTTFKALAGKYYHKPAKTISDYQTGLLIRKILKTFPVESQLKRVIVSKRLVRELADFLKLLRLNLISPKDIPSDKSDTLLTELKRLYLKLEDEISECGCVSEQKVTLTGSDNIDSRFRAIFVLNAQDITPVEYHFLKSVMEKSQLTVISGDPYRNIHRFEGGEPDILRFRLIQDFPAAATIHLKSSYKIGAERIEFANRMFDPESAEFLPANGESTDSIFYHEFSSPIEETNAIANTIEKLVRIQKIPAEKIGIALRAPGMSGPRFKRSLELKNISCSGGDTPFLPLKVQEYFAEIRNFDSADDISNQFKIISGKYIFEARDDEYLCDALKTAEKLIMETLVVTTDAPWENITGSAMEEYLMHSADSRIKGVKITSIHAAEGKDFDIVFMPDLVESIFPAEVEYQSIFSVRWMEDFRRKIGKPLSYLERADIDKHLNEERRLFYTGISLAKSEVYLSRSLTSNGETRNPSIFLTETGILPVTEDNKLTEWCVPNGGFLSVEKSLTAEIIKIMQNSPVSAIIEIQNKLEEITGQTALEKLKRDINLNLQKHIDFTIDHLSAGALNTYLYCPRQFYYSYVLKLPTPTTPGMSGGKIMHEILETIHLPGGNLNAALASENLNSLLDKFIEADENIDADSGEAVTIKRLLNKIIRQYIADPEAHQGNVILLETRFEWTPEPGIKIVGRIDRIDETPEGVELIDYKSRGEKKHKALTTKFSDLSKEKPDIQLPVYFAAAEDALGMEVAYISLLPLEFKNAGPQRIRFEIVDGETKKEKLSRTLLRQIRSEVIELSRKVMTQTEFTIGEHTKCRDVYAGIICPYIHICDVAGV